MANRNMRKQALVRNQLCTICLAWGPEVAKHNRVPSLDCDGYRNLSLARLARKNLMPQSGVPGRYRPKEARGQSVSWGQIALFCCLFVACLLPVCCLSFVACLLPIQRVHKL